MPADVSVKVNENNGDIMYNKGKVLRLTMNSFTASGSHRYLDVRRNDKLGRA